jgi:hypothetical protein
MKTAAVGGKNVGKKTAKDAEPKRYGTLIRVSEAFAEAMGEASSFEGMSVAQFAETRLLPVVKQHYKEAVIAKARRLQSEA